MKIIIFMVGFLIPMILFADELPYTFSSGAVIKAAEMNENFSHLVNNIVAIDENINQLGTSIDNLDALAVEVAAAKAKIEVLESFLTSSSSVENNGSVEFVGFSDSLVFGDIGIQSGLAACPSKYSGSHICTINELESSDDWAGFDGLGSSSIFIAAGAGQTKSNPCNNFSAYEDQYTTFGYISNGKVFVRESDTCGTWVRGDIPFATYIRSRYQEGSYYSGGDSTGNCVNRWLSSDQISSHYIEVSANNSPGTNGSLTIQMCASSLPAACCK